MGLRAEATALRERNRTIEADQGRLGAEHAANLDRALVQVLPSDTTEGEGERVAHSQ